MLRSWFGVAFFSPYRTTTLPAWSPPLVGPVKLNFNGIVVGNLGQSGIGGLFRDSLAFCLLSFLGLPNFCLVHGAKLIAFRTGLGEANRLSIHSYIIEGDFSCVICWASVCSAYPWRLTDAAEEVLELAVNLNASFVHVLCSANEAADSLAKYRMHPEICRFPSLHFYDNKLLNGNTMDMKSKKFHENPYLGPYVFFDVLDGRENRGKNSGALSLYNESEADAAVEVLRFFKKRFPSEFIGGRIGIITPYRSQVSLLRARFSNVFGSDVIADMEFNTIDGFQGREVDILILSTVRASDQSAEEPGFNSSNIGFVADIRRMNVALTRAKLSLWIVGNARTLQTNFNWAALFKDAEERNLVISVARPYESIFRKPLSPSRRSHNLVSSKSHLRNLKHAKGINCTNQGVKETGCISKKSDERRNGHLDRVVERRTSRHRPDCDVIRTNRKHRTSSNTVDAVKRMDDKPSKDLKSTKIVKPVVGDSKDQGQEIGQRSNLVGAPHTGKEREKLDRSRCSCSIVQPKKDTGAGIRVLKVSKEVEESSKHGKLGDLSQKKVVVSPSSTEGCHQEKGAKNHGNAFSRDGKSEETFATRKRQRDAVDGLLSSALISSKKHETSSRSAPVRRQLSPTAAASGANKPSNPSKAQPIASTRQRGATLSPHRHSHHPRNRRDHSSSGRDLDEEWKYFKDIIRESKER